MNHQRPNNQKNLYTLFLHRDDYSLCVPYHIYRRKYFRELFDLVPAVEFSNCTVSHQSYIIHSIWTRYGATSLLCSLSANCSLLAKLKKKSRINHGIFGIFQAVFFASHSEFVTKSFPIKTHIMAFVMIQYRALFLYSHLPCN